MIRAILFWSPFTAPRTARWASFAASAIFFLLAWTIACLWVRSYVVADSVVYEATGGSAGAGVSSGELLLSASIAHNAHPRGTLHLQYTPQQMDPLVGNLIQWRRWGFGYSYSGPHGEGWGLVTVPVWCPLLLFLLLFTRYVRLYRRDRLRQQRSSGGLCMKCGYDLRATPGRCPECGAAGSTSLSGPKPAA